MKTLAYYIWCLSEFSGISLGRFAPYVFGKMIGSKPIKINPKSSEPTVKCDFFLEVNGQECICEIYETEDGNVTDYGVYPLREDGSNGEPIEEPGEDVGLQAQEFYYAWVNQNFED